MRSAVLCFAPQDRSFAQELSVFLRTNCRLTISDEETGDLVEGVDRGLSDITIALLSPDSVNNLGPRERWEHALVAQPQAFDSQIVFLLVRPCKFPPLLRRGNFFEGRRQLKRWLLARDHSQTPFTALQDADEVLAPQLLDDLKSRLADQPGSETDFAAGTALAFAHACQEDFEGVFWIDCANRSWAGILGDVANALGLRLSGTVDQNVCALQEFCSTRRCLFVFQDMSRQLRALVSLGERSSVIFTAQGPPRDQRPLVEVQALFSSWTRNSAACLAALGDAFFYLQTGRGLELGDAIIALLKDNDRLAEAYEFLDVLMTAEKTGGDFARLHRLSWEQSWILDHWNHPLPLPSPLLRLPQPSQLVLDL